MVESHEAEADSKPTLRVRGIDAVLRTNRPKRGTLLLHAAVLPALKREPISWAVFGIRDSRQLVSHRVAVRTLWERDVDRVNLQSISVSPTIRRIELRLSDQVADAIFADVASVRVPIPPGSHPHGTDGTRYRLQLGEFFATSVFEWWQRGPESWEPLTQAFRKLWTMLESLPEIALKE